MIKRNAILKIFLALVLVSGAVHAADLTWTGTGTGGTWIDGGAGKFGGPTWNNATPDSATFAGTAETVALGGPITVSNITFTTANYVISGNTLTFPANATVTAGGVSATIQAGITGSPDFVLTNYNGDTLTLNPAGGLTMAVGKITSYNLGNHNLVLNGASSGNTATQINYQRTGAAHRFFITKNGSSTWQIGEFGGNANEMDVYINDGTLVIAGVLDDVEWIRVGNAPGDDAVLEFSNSGVLLEPGRFEAYGGIISNSSGSTITFTDGDLTFRADGITFTGDNMDLGTGAGTLASADNPITVTAGTTLTIGGVIDDSTSVRNLIKKGAGTLTLEAASTYNGSTTVEAGTLSLGQEYLDDTAFLNISNGATLNLNYTGTDTVFMLNIGGANLAAGTWGSNGHATADFTTNAITGNGLINNIGGLAPAGTWYWDGANVGGTGDGASSGGDGVWSTSNANWDGGLTARSVWNNTTNDRAEFRTANGSVTLDSDISLGSIQVDGVTAYTFGTADETHSLHFGGSNRVDTEWVDVTFRCGITGNPYIDYDGRAAGHNGFLSMKPTASVTQHIGTIDGANQGNNFHVYLEGDSTGNTIADIDYKVGGSWMFLHKRGAGTWTVTNITYTGGGTVTVEAGKLIVNGVANSPQTFTVSSGATLAGLGVINDPVTVNAGGTLAPGDLTGTLTVTNNSCTINGDLDITVNGGSHSALAVQNMLTISNATLNVNVGSSPGSDIVIAQCGTLVGEFAATNGVDAWEIDYTGNTITLLPPAGGTVLIIR